jgi:hypothetical protein
MPISAINPSDSMYTSALQQQAQVQQPQVQETRPDRENDGDSDDKKVNVTKAPGPTVNLNGQAIGSIVNEVA